jgi:hypothetical protein
MTAAMTEAPMSQPPRQPPLSIHALWLPEGESTNADGTRLPCAVTQLAESLFSNFARALGAPLDRGLNIPVRFHQGKPPPATVLDGSDHSVLVVLVTDRMVIDRDWQLGLETLARAVARHGSRHRMYMVALSPFSFNLLPGVAVSNFIRLQGLPQAKRAVRLCTTLTHELCRLLQGCDEKKSVIGDTQRLAPAPLKLFLSHAKADGEALAQALRDHIESSGAIESFFDTNDIDPGFDFRVYLEEHVARSVLVVLQTDHYASRTWCRRELLWAKSKDCPVVLINAVKEREERAFPYLGNAPLLRVDGDQPDWPERVVALALREALRRLWFKAQLARLVELNMVPPGLHPSLGPPEVLNLITGASPTSLPAGTRGLIYPDPPLGSEERALLSLAAPGLIFTTPTSCMNALLEPGSPPQLQGMRVALSISDSPDLADYAMGPAHLQDAMTELARYLLNQGAHLVYGGDLRPEGFTQQLLELVAAYNDASDGEALPSPTHRVDFASQRLSNYVAWPISLNYSHAQLAQHYLKGVFEFIDPAGDLDLSADQRGQFVPPDTSEHRYWWFRCLTAMRAAMANATDARVLLGGQTRGFAGGMPGLVEETLLALERKQPVFLIGGMGGCSRVIIDAIQGAQPPELSVEYQTDGENFAGYRRFLDEQKTQRHAVQVDYPAMVARLNAAGIGGLNNSLSDEENLELFTTPHVLLMVSLVLKGLAACRARSAALGA